MEGSPSSSSSSSPGTNPDEGQMVRVPLSKNDPIAEMMLRDATWAEQDLKRQQHHGLPMRLKWELHVVVLGWKTDESKVSSLPSLTAVVELGENGHYFKLETPQGPAASHAFGGEMGELPKSVMTAYHQRKDKLRLSLRNGLVEIGYSNFGLKDLEKGKPRVGWIKIKNDSRDEKGRRNVVVGSINIGMLISPSLKAEVLFLMDMQEREVLFYQDSETLVDLNPVFAKSSMTPFSWTDERGLLVISSNNKVVLATVQRKGDVVNVVQPAKDPYWQCSVTRALENTFRVDGCWAGNISEQVKPRGGIVFFDVKNERGQVVARAEWRNSRDLKLSVDDPSEDPIVHIGVFLAIVELKRK
jgi:hypothetical protein